MESDHGNPQTGTRVNSGSIVVLILLLQGHAIERTNDWMALYFVSLIVLTRFFLFNMFIACILHAFAEMRIEEEEEMLTYDGE